MARTAVSGLLLPLVVLVSLSSAVIVDRPDEASYDYIIVGGGTSGCVVASRLSEDSDVSVLVIEAGPLLDGEQEFDDLLVQPTFERLDPTRSMYTWPNLSTAPIEGLNGRKSDIQSAMVAGGGSAVNGKLFARGSKRDYDDWARYLDDEGWGWESMLHYFKKSETFTPPIESYREQGNVTWDMDAHGQDGPISSTFPPQFVPSTTNKIAAHKALGIPLKEEQGSGDNIGSIWYPQSARADDFTRSYSKREFYDPVRERPNLHFLAENAVTRILFDGTTAVGVEYSEGPETTIKSASVKREVIVAGGAVKSPQLLQISGIGSQSLLRELGIDSISDLPVGENFQDHATLDVGYNFTFEFDEQMWREKTNKTWLDAQYELYLETHTGYYTVTGDNNMVLLSFSMLHGDKAKSLLSKFKCRDASIYLQPGVDESTAEAYRRQHSLVLSSMSTDNQGVDEKTSLGQRIVFDKPLSRGFVRATSTSIWDTPIVDHRTLSHPLDLENMLASVRMTRKIMGTEEMAPLEPVETDPGLEVDDDEGLTEFIREKMSPGGAHGCCAAPLGTVLDVELKVRGVTGVRVVDTSSWPIIPGAHASQATAYAVAERAADLIRGVNLLAK